METTMWTYTTPDFIGHDESLSTIDTTRRLFRSMLGQDRSQRRWAFAVFTDQIRDSVIACSSKHLHQQSSAHPAMTGLLGQWAGKAGCPWEEGNSTLLISRCNIGSHKYLMAGERRPQLTDVVVEQKKKHEQCEKKLGHSAVMLVGSLMDDNWLVVWTPLKNISQLGWLFPIYGKIKNVPNHQPVIDSQCRSEIG